MKIIVTGNLGYVGPLVIKQLRQSYPDAKLVGFDTGYFAHCLTGVSVLPEHDLDAQFFGDVRDAPDELFQDADVLVQLAAISNDPMGQLNEKVTRSINDIAGFNIAKQAVAAGVGRIVFASSCSVYGAGGDDARTEDSPTDPLTAYARSKVAQEQTLKELAKTGTAVTCLRFATACGMSDRLRLDLVLNDFVASALSTGKITVLSDGTPWRPLIHVRDMARAIDWAVQRDVEKEPFQIVNTGSDVWNYQIRDLAHAVAEVIEGVEVSINEAAEPDRRSYRVSFERFASIAPEHQPQVSLHDAVADLAEGLKRMDFKDANFRQSSLARLVTLNRLRETNLIDDELFWVK